MSPMNLPLSDAAIHRFSQVLYRCFEEIGATKAALYLALDSTEGFHLVTHYGWPRPAPPPESIPFDAPLLLWLQRERRAVTANHPHIPPELQPFAHGSDQPRFLVTPIFVAGQWVGLLMQKNKLKGALFDPVKDNPLTLPIVEELAQTIQEFKLHQASDPANRPSAAPDGHSPSDIKAVSVPVPRSGAMVDTLHPPTAEALEEVRPNDTGSAVFHEQPISRLIGLPKLEEEGTEEEGEAPDAAPARMRRGMFLPEQRTFFWETAKLLFAFVPLAAVGLWMDEPHEMRPILLYSRMPMGPELKQQVMASLTFHLPGVQERDLRLLSQAEWAEKEPVAGAFKTYLPVLLQEEGGAQDLVLLFRLEDRPFSTHEQAFIQHVARILGFHLQEARLHERYHRAFLSVSHRLLASMEGRTPSLRPHSIATAKLARNLALRMDLSSPDVEAVSIAAILHDVGTVLLDPELLSKPSLTDQEMAKVRSHPMLAATFLKDFRFPFDVLTIIRHHHERWDGRGYPDGLAGEAIPIGSRIINLVEAYEVMVTGRPYKGAMTLEEIVAEMQQEAGKQFDPSLVPEFIRLLQARAAR